MHKTSLIQSTVSFVVGEEDNKTKVEGAWALATNLNVQDHFLVPFPGKKNLITD